MLKKQRRNKFSKEEDLIIISYVSVNGFTKWNNIKIPNRSTRAIKERYFNFLKVKSSNTWNKNDDVMLLKMIAKYGRKWKFLSYFFPTKNEIFLKNRYKFLLRTR